jgi:hypothetical protein
MFCDFYVMLDHLIWGYCEVSVLVHYRFSEGYRLYFNPEKKYRLPNDLNSLDSLRYDNFALCKHVIPLPVFFKRGCDGDVAA